MSEIVIRNVSETKKHKLNVLIRKQGYTSLSEFFRKVIDEVVSQNNINFLVNDSILQNLINLNDSVRILTEASNRNVETVSDVKNLLVEFLNEVS